MYYNTHACPLKIATWIYLYVLKTIIFFIFVSFYCIEVCFFKGMCVCARACMHARAHTVHIHIFNSKQAYLCFVRNHSTKLKIFNSGYFLTFLCIYEPPLIFIDVILLFLLLRLHCLCTVIIHPFSSVQLDFCLWAPFETSILHFNVKQEFLYAYSMLPLEQLLYVTLSFHQNHICCCVNLLNSKQL